MITIKIEKETPAAVMEATALFIKQISRIIHDGMEPVTGVIAPNESVPAAPESVKIESGEINSVLVRKDTPVTSTIPTPPAPTSAPVAPTAPAASGAELDKDGIPWDDRLHSRGKSKNADGTWRRKRGISDTLVRQVEAELRNTDLDDSDAGLVAACVPPAPTSAPVAPTAPTPPAPTTVPPAPDMGAASAPNPFAANSGQVAQGVPPVVPASPAAAGRSYSELETLISQLILTNKTDALKIMDVCTKNNIAAVTVLKDAQPEVIGLVYDAIQASAQ